MGAVWRGSAAALLAARRTLRRRQPHETGPSLKLGIGGGVAIDEAGREDATAAARGEHTPHDPGLGWR